MGNMSGRVVGTRAPAGAGSEVPVKTVGAQSPCGRLPLLNIPRPEWMPGAGGDKSPASWHQGDLAGRSHTVQLGGLLINSGHWGGGSEAGLPGDPDYWRPPPGGMLNGLFIAGGLFVALQPPDPGSYDDSGTRLLGNIFPAPSPGCCWRGSDLELIERQGFFETFSAAGSPLKSPPSPQGMRPPSLDFPQVLKWF